MPQTQATTSTTLTDIGDFLDQVYQSCNFYTSKPNPPDQTSGEGFHRRPFITLTYAQSLDGKIAGAEGQQLRLSGNQSLKMTHLLRARHDGIMVGIGTVIKDDPELTARNLSFTIPLDDQPQPIVLDTALRTPIDCKLIKNYQNQIGKQPWVLCARSAMSLQGRQQLEASGARVIPITNGMNPSKEGLNLEKVFEVCKLHGINRLMVEGGAKVVSSCLNHVADDPLLNMLIVTVSPYMVGEGVMVNTTSIDSLSLLRHVQTKIMGSDAIFAYTTTSAVEEE